MSKLANLKKKAADLEHKRLFDRALAVYEELLQEQDGAEEADVGLFNRVGDLHLRQGNVEAALGRYEQAVELYVDRGFHNNAIALCNKILRQDPSRAEIHFRLGQISCSKGFRTEARRHFQEYVAQLNRSGSLDRAVGVIAAYADENEQLDDVRAVLADILLTHGRVADAVGQLGRLREHYEAQDRHADAQAILGRILELDPEFRHGSEPATADDLEPDDGGLAASTGAASRSQSSHRQPVVPELVLFEPTEFAAPVRSTPSAPQAVAEATGLLDDHGALAAEAAGAREDTPLTAAEQLGETIAGTPGQGVSMPLGLIRGADFGILPADSEPEASPLGLELTAMDGGMSELIVDEPLDGLVGSAAGANEHERSGGSGLESLDAEGDPMVLAAAWDADGGAWDSSSLADEHAPGSALDLTFPDDEPLRPEADADAADAPEFLIIEDEPAGMSTGSLLSIDGSAEAAEALVIPGDDAAAAESLVLFTDDAATAGESLYTAAGPGAADQSDSLVFLTDDSPRAAGAADDVPTLSDLPAERSADDVAGAPDAAGSADAAESAATFGGWVLTGGDADAADDSPPAAGEAVYSDDDAFIGFEEPAPPAVAAAPAAPPPPAAALSDAPPAAVPAVVPAAPPALPATVAEPEGAADPSFVNLGDWLREDDEPRSTRMVAEERAPSGDEQADFAEMLRKFKQGVAENVDDDDYASHYDLGIAFREMGLVDEAIAAFQRALRGTSQRVRAFEALGQCFLDREQYAVAASVLQRALQEPGADDERLVGVLYLLGRAAEAQNQRTEALRYYQRVFAVDIEFGDVADRIGAMERVPL